VFYFFRVVLSYGFLFLHRGALNLQIRVSNRRKSKASNDMGNEIDDRYKLAPDPKAQLAEILGKRKSPGASNLSTVCGPQKPLIGELVITLPLPPLETHPNSRVSRWRKAKAIKAQRADAGLACLAHGVPRLYLASAHVQATFYFTTNRHRDQDNVAAWLKATWDGFVGYGLFADDRGLRHEPVTIFVEPANSRLVVKVWAG
jgi:hypothetical protein